MKLRVIKKLGNGEKERIGDEGLVKLNGNRLRIDGGKGWKNNLGERIKVKKKKEVREK